MQVKRNNQTTEIASRFAVAPMIDWTDRHCRFFHRQLSTQARLYTEMIVADAILKGDREYLIGFNETEHPLTLQLGGNDPAKLAEAAKIAAQFGYAEVNLNVGCPSDRVQSGTFGACLMRTPDLVADCIAAMQHAVQIPVTVKCRLGVDDQDPNESLFSLVEKVSATGCETFIVHARKAWLQGLSPKQNRAIPPLDYDVVRRLKKVHPQLTIVLNGGVRTITEARQHLTTFDGVMMGRAAYETPYILATIDRDIFNSNAPVISRRDVAENMIRYLERYIGRGGKPHAVTRHMLGLFHGQPGARRWRQHLSVEATKPGSAAEVLRNALEALPDAAFEEAA